MANSKHAHLRYNIIDYCLRKKAFTFAQLLAYLNLKIAEAYPGEGISTRTLREDLKVFRDKKKGFGAPLPEKMRVLRYTDAQFSIAQKPLLGYEQYLLEAAHQLLERFENHPKYDRLAEALVKFQEEEEIDKQAAKILFYDHNEEYKGIQNLKPLYLAIKKKQVLEIHYKGFKDSQPTSFLFHPYILKQYNRRWFVFGYNQTAAINEWSIPLDKRLLSYTIAEEEAHLPSTTNWESFFRNLIGVVRPREAIKEKIILRFHNGREAYFKTKPLQADYEEFFEEEKQNQIWFEAITNPELIQQLLSYGKDLEVIAPEHLKDKMKEQVQQMQAFYR